MDDPAAYVFYYVYNLQGDVIALTNNTGAIVAKYTYDAYGNPLGVTDANGNDISGNPTYVSNLNPFRYRGYFYDVDTGLYYLNSRYYDANTSRFINADGYAVLTATPKALTDKNLFAYCDNNPVNRADGSGRFWNVIIGAGLGAIISGAIELGAQLISNGGDLDSVNWGDVGKSALAGAISGAIGGVAGYIPINNAVGRVAVDAFVGGIGDLAGDYFTGEINNFSDAGKSFANGFVSSGLGSAGEQALKKLRLNKFNKLNRASKKTVLQEKVFTNSNKFRNINLNNYNESEAFQSYIGRWSSSFNYFFSSA